MEPFIRVRLRPFVVRKIPQKQDADVSSLWSLLTMLHCVHSRPFCGFKAHLVRTLRDQFE